MTFAPLARVVTEMSCGEALEFQHAYDLEVTEEQYAEMIRAKTGSLIGAATEIGGYITNNDNRLYIRAFAAGNPVALAQYVQAGTVLYLSGHYPIGEGVQA